MVSLYLQRAPEHVQSGTVEPRQSVSQSGKRRKTTLPFITEDGTDEDETEPHVHPPQKMKDAHKRRPASSLLVMINEMPPAETRDSIPSVYEIPL
ncbi:hypothetical protein ACET3Z_003862 [Daucus carota]